MSKQKNSEQTKESSKQKKSRTDLGEVAERDVVLEVPEHGGVDFKARHVLGGDRAHLLEGALCFTVRRLVIVRLADVLLHPPGVALFIG